MDWKTWKEEVKDEVQAQLSVEFDEVKIPQHEMKDCWRLGMSPGDFVAERLAVHQEREELDLRLEL